MRAIRLLILVLLPLSASARGLGGEVSPEEKKATIAFIEGLRDKESGAFKNTADAKPSLRATNGAVKSLKALGVKVTEIEKLRKFVLSCYDKESGAFAEPGGKPDVTITSIGIIVACEVGVARKDFPEALGYVLARHKNFEEVRIVAAAVEAWGSENLHLGQLRDFIKAEHEIAAGDARVNASELVTWLRLKSADRYKDWVVERLDKLGKTLAPNQRTDGGWGKLGEKTSDIESTYRVVRAFKMLEAKPKDIPRLRKFIASHRNKDGGSASKPGEASTMSGTYYAVIIAKWLDEMDAKK